MIRAGLKPIFAAASLVLIVGILPGVALAQSASPADFSFDGFSGSYDLGRDSKDVATINAQEDMVVNFPSGGNLYGISRSLPETYQGHSLNLKLISVTDAFDNPVTYHISFDDNNEVITTGDPSIILSGPETYKIKYQTSGVAAIGPNSDQFLIDVNGRGWQETFASVKAFIQISKNFAANLITQPICYIGYQNMTGKACTIGSQNTASGPLVTAATTQPLGAHQALLVKFDFKKGTFQQQPTTSSSHWAVEAGLALIALVVVYRLTKLIKGS